jgi:hypothetical protein
MGLICRRLPSGAIKAIAWGGEVNLKGRNAELVGTTLNARDQLGKLLYRGGNEGEGDRAWRRAPTCTMPIHYLIRTGILTIYRMHHAARHLYQSRH